MLMMSIMMTTSTMEDPASLIGEKLTSHFTGDSPTSGELFYDEKLFVDFIILSIEVADSVAIDTFLHVPKLLIGEIIPRCTIWSK